MTRKERDVRRGWGVAHSSHRFHYFVWEGGRGNPVASACGKFLFRRWAKYGSNDMRMGGSDCPQCAKFATTAD